MSLYSNSSGETKEMALSDNFNQYHKSNYANMHVHFSDIVVNIDTQQRTISLTSPKVSPGILRQGVLKNHNGNHVIIDQPLTPQAPPTSDSIRDKELPISNCSFDNVNGINNGKGKHHQRIISIDLRSNLSRTQIDRDPQKIYEVLNHLGMGSLGSVTCVRKRSHQVGGSARQKIIDIAEDDETDSKKCFQVPLINSLFRFCVFQKNNIKENEKDAFVVVPNISKRSKVKNDNNTSTNLKEDHQPDIIHAMKSIRLLHASDVRYLNELKNEVDILKELDHPHIVRVIETFHYQKQMFVIMELCSGGDLYTRSPYKEDEAAHICSSIVSAIAYTHSRGM